MNSISGEMVERNMVVFIERIKIKLIKEIIFSRNKKIINFDKIFNGRGLKQK